MIDFDPAKDALNIENHGISLARAADLEILTQFADDRFYEPRFRAYGLIDGVPYCLAFVVRNDRVRAISLRRAHKKEINRYVPI